MIQGHGGNIFETAERLRCAPSEIIDMSSNVNPLGPMPELVEHLRKILPEAISVLPRVDSADIVGLFARRYNLDPFCALASNGSTQLIYDIPRAFETKKAIILGPTYADYADACRMQGVSFDEFFAEEDDGFVPDLSRFGDKLSSADTAFICNPNNPTGALLPARQLRDLCSAHPRVRFVVDESYLPFAPEGERQSMAGCGLGNVVVLNSMSKIYRLPGLRIGFLIGQPEMIQKVVRYRQPWCVNGLAQAAVSYLMTHPQNTDAFVAKTRVFLAAERMNFVRALNEVPDIQFYDSSTSFLLAKLSGRFTAQKVWDFLCRQRILIRDCTNFGGLTNHFVRFSLKTHDINTIVTQKLALWMKS